MLAGGRRVELLVFDDVTQALGVQKDNKIVVAGTSDNGFAVVRYTLDGGLDRDFGQGGKVTIRIGTYERQPDEAFALALQADRNSLECPLLWLCHVPLQSGWQSRPELWHRRESHHPY